LVMMALVGAARHQKNFTIINCICLLVLAPGAS
jgi:hypothetical protein